MTSPNEDEKNDAADGVRPVVPFDACLARFAADETVEDWFSTATGAKGAATRRSRFATFPEVLPVQVRRYYVASDWTPKKLDALVPMPETIDLGALRGVGLQPGETELPEAADAAAAAVPEIPTDAPAVPADRERFRAGSRHRRAASRNGVQRERLAPSGGGDAERRRRARDGVGVRAH